MGLSCQQYVITLADRFHFASWYNHASFSCFLAYFDVLLFYTLLAIVAIHPFCLVYLCFLLFDISTMKLLWDIVLEFFFLQILGNSDLKMEVEVPID